MVSDGHRRCLSGLPRFLRTVRVVPRGRLRRLTTRRPNRTVEQSEHFPMTIPTTFEALGVSRDLVAALAEQDIVEPFPIQVLTVAEALAGRDVCGKAKTGSGKTLAFGLPLIERVQAARPRCPTGLVLVPTRELANQVFGVLEPLAARRGHRVAAVYGGVGFDAQIAALRGG